MKLQAAWKRSGRYARLNEEEYAALKSAKKALLEALRAYHIKNAISHELLVAARDNYLNQYGARVEDVDRMDGKVRDENDEPGSFSRKEALRQTYGPSRDSGSTVRRGHRYTR